MKKIELFKELVNYHNSKEFKTNYLKNAEEEIGEEILFSLVFSILVWQKRMINYQPMRNVHYDNEKKAYPLSQLKLKQFKKLFTLCPELSDLFIIKNENMMYNEVLTDEEKATLMTLADEHIIDRQIRITRRRPKRK